MDRADCTTLCSERGACAAAVCQQPVGQHGADRGLSGEVGGVAVHGDVQQWGESSGGVGLLPGQLWPRQTQSLQLVDQVTLPFYLLGTVELKASLEVWSGQKINVGVVYHKFCTVWSVELCGNDGRYHTDQGWG